MQVSSAWRYRAVLAVVVMLVLAGVSTASAQDSSSTHRFFSFLGDVTIDDARLQPGHEIVALIGEQEVGRATVNAAGAWILDVDANLLSSEPCNVSFVINGYRVDYDLDTCERRVRLALLTPAGDAGDSANQAAADDKNDDEDKQDQGIVRPAPPRTGTGGLLDHAGSADWPRTAAITGVLMLIVSGVALLLSRSTDGVH